MITIKDVPMWVVSGGIGHAVASERGCCYTACNSLIYGQLQKEVPRRICKKCRQRLKQAKLKGGK